MASDGGSRAHDDLNCTELHGFGSGGIIKGKISIHLARVCGERKEDFVRQYFWAQD